ncbi:hypothetical protein Taro_013488 [Colocasia esculenta]|uniref:Uncharacterized protein n=1 Tax=Colocasia esculenta TaxID=4460 RepID=A0A843UFP9_COLES|nr:hypothetical protein [Colocasia esculenta]
MSHCDDALFTDGDWYNRIGMKRVVTPWQNRAFTSSAWPGEVLLVCFSAIRARGTWLDVFSPRGSRVEPEKCRAMASLGQQEVRESRRLPNHLLVPGRTVVEQGLATPSSIV